MAPVIVQLNGCPSFCNHYSGRWSEVFRFSWWYCSIHGCIIHRIMLQEVLLTDSAQSTPYDMS